MVKLEAKFMSIWFIFFIINFLLKNIILNNNNKSEKIKFIYDIKEEFREMIKTNALKGFWFLTNKNKYFDLFKELCNNTLWNYNFG